MTGSAWAPQTAQLVNGNVQNDGSADSPRGWATNTDANYTFIVTSHSRAEIKNPTAARTATLPSTGVKAGKQYELLVSGATETNYVALQSSGANEIDRIGGEGRILVQAVIDDPSAAADWKVVDVWEKTSLPTVTHTWTGTTPPSTLLSEKLLLSRNNKMITIYHEFRYSVAGSALTRLLMTAAIPTRIYTKIDASVGSWPYRAGLGIISTADNAISSIVDSSAWIQVNAGNIAIDTAAANVKNGTAVFTFTLI